jgi:dethiobiotin synthetase
MSRRVVVTGTDTGIGKTVFAAGLADLLDACYWKPIQSGLEGEADSQVVGRLGGLSSKRILSECYRLRTPVAPHQSAAIDGVRIEIDRLAVPDTGGRPLVIEGAGGLMVPLDPSTLYIDVFARWRLPVVLCARTSLGTINHSLLSIEALRRREIETLGVAFIGEDNPESERAICGIGGVKRLGRLPRLSTLTRSSLREAFATAFKPGDFGL